MLEGLSEAFADSLAKDTKAPAVVTCTIEEALTEEHLQDYAAQSGQLGTTVKAAEKDIRTLRAQHHSVARMLAEGIPESIVAEMCNYDKSYISLLKQNPAMIELIEHYRAPGNTSARLIGEQLRRVAGMSLEELETKLLHKELSANELLQLAKLGFDRSGHGPQSSVHQVTEHHVVDHAELQRLYREAREADAGYIVNPADVRQVVEQAKLEDKSE